MDWCRRIQPLCVSAFSARQRLINELSPRFRTYMSRSIFPLFLIAATGCMTYPKPLYFTLDMTTPPGEGAGYTALDGRLVEVDAIRVTDKLVRRDVLVRIDSTELEYYHDAKWVARVPDLVAEKLAVEFAPPPGADEDSDRSVIILFGTLLAFEQVDTEAGPYAHIKLEAELRAEEASRYEPAFEGTYEYFEPIDAEGPFPKVTVDKLSDGLEVIAARIAGDANAVQFQVK